MYLVADGFIWLGRPHQSIIYFYVTHQPCIGRVLTKDLPTYVVFLSLSFALQSSLGKHFCKNWICKIGIKSCGVLSQTFPKTIESKSCCFLNGPFRPLFIFYLFCTIQLTVNKSFIKQQWLLRCRKRLFVDFTTAFGFQRLVSKVHKITATDAI